MELNDTVEMMNNADYRERFRAEYFQTKIRHDKLCSFLEKYANGELSFTPSCSYDLLFLQLSTMNSYLLVLEERARTEGIDLSLPSKMMMQ